MTSTPVGMRCPECANQRTRVRNPVGAPTRTDAPATYAIIAICVAAYVAELIGGGSGAFDERRPRRARGQRDPGGGDGGADR